MTEQMEKNELKKKGTVMSKVSEPTKLEPVDSVLSEDREEQRESVMYIGTSLPSIGLQQHALFKNNVPEKIKQHIEKCPAIGALLVPISRLAQARHQIMVKGTAEYTLNQQVLSYGRGEA
ncbi:hypothetical protein ABER98_01725 [Domibacillus aminovorans]|uniref:hypothetical protein n=1 Tax=Domibacillus aminovorans TaxID=29332 RepID=UPI003D22EF13